MQPIQFFLPAFYTIFLWWFTTGLVMAVYKRSPLLTRIGFGVATLALIAAFGGVLITREQTEPRDVYLSVTCGIIIWSWQVAGYYLGFITGPPKVKEPHVWNRSLAERFRLALRFSLYHEVLALLCGVLIAALTWSHGNRWALWIYLALWLMHVSAKVNVFLGVRNFRIELLPRHLHHLDSLLTKQPNNMFFPFSVVLSSSVTAALIYNAVAPGTDPADAAGFLLVATMIALGVMEHWLLVLPIPATLWGWGILPLPNPPAPKRTEAEQVVEGS